MKDEENIPVIVKTMEKKYYTIKLEINRRNVEEKSFTYFASGIFENCGEGHNTDMNEIGATNCMQESMPQVKILTFFTYIVFLDFTCLLMIFT